MSNAKFLLLHYHLFKNAGSTVEHILKKNFGTDHYDIHGPEANASVTMADVKKFISLHPDAKSITSHHLRYPVLDFDDYKIIDIVYIRHPIDRLYSMFSYYKKIAWETASPDVISKTFDEFLIKMFRFQPYNSINAQTNFWVNPGDYYFPPSEIDLETASFNLRKVKWLGTVDEFDKSLEVASHFLRPIYPRFDKTYKVMNVATNVKENQNINEKINRLRDEFGDVINLAEKFNSLDIDLWKICNQEIDRRYSFLV